MEFWDGSRFFRAVAFKRHIHTSCAGERKTPVFFVGGFLAENRKAWEIISRSFRNLDCGPALFLRHADFLGALGCLGATIEGKGDL